MALRRKGGRERTIDYWPGFVDALSTLLLAIMFLLTVFVLAQFILSREISGRDEVLERLNNQINELTELLALEKGGNQDLEDSFANLQAQLTNAETERSRLQQLLDKGAGTSDAATARVGVLNEELSKQKEVSQQALSQVELLNQQIAALRAQIAAVEEALQVSEARDKASQTKIADLGKRLNVALAQRVQELNRYRSDFFGRLARDPVRPREHPHRRRPLRLPVGSPLPARAAPTLDTALARRRWRKLAAGRVSNWRREIPAEINWVLQRRRPYRQCVAALGHGPLCRDNWELSSARATSVVKFLIVPGRACRIGWWPPVSASIQPLAAGRQRRGEEPESPHRAQAHGEIDSCSRSSEVTTMATPMATAIFQKSRRLRRPGRLSGQMTCSAIRITPMMGMTFVKLFRPRVECATYSAPFVSMAIVVPPVG
ncbi:MAG: peptidoglycan -binding protein [Rhizobium sp.]|nr:peptidoglycan -binding protein [Rhizobium sp.]